MLLKETIEIFILCGVLVLQIQLSKCQANPRFGRQKIPGPSLPVKIEKRDASPQALLLKPRLPQRSHVELVRSNNDGPKEDGSYSFSYETSDGSKREEQGSFQGPSSSLTVRGSYSYIAPDGTLVEVKYIADENGFRAESPHIPAIPPHSLQQIKAAEEAPRLRPVKFGSGPRLVAQSHAPARNIVNGEFDYY